MNAKWGLAGLKKAPIAFTYQVGAPFGCGGGGGGMRHNNVNTKWQRNEPKKTQTRNANTKTKTSMQTTKIMHALATNSGWVAIPRRVTTKPSQAAECYP